MGQESYADYRRAIHDQATVHAMMKGRTTWFRT
jgi:hypothetical protein